MGVISKFRAFSWLAIILAGSSSYTATIAATPGFSFGPSSTEITGTSAKVWLRADEPREIRVEFSEKRDFSNARMTRPVSATVESDLTTVHHLTGLMPDTEYFYRGVTSAKASSGAALHGETGRFRTTPARPQTFRFAVSGDMKAQYQPFTLFDRIGEKKPDFFVILGDTMYADRPIDEFNESLNHYRAKHKENRHDPHLQKFLKSVPVYAIWDDHEVEDQFNSSTDGDKIRNGRTAFREYWPVESDDETILYRKFSWTTLADFFILDTRQFRSAETEIDGPRPGVTMLGARQKSWFLKALSESKAQFKFVFTSVPFNRKINSDKWGGFVSERREIRDHIALNYINGVVFISADLHVGADNTVIFRKEWKEYVVGPIATQLDCHGKQSFYKKIGRFYMCDSYNYLLFELTMENGVASAELQFLDTENKIRFRDKFTADGF